MAEVIHKVLVRIEGQEFQVEVEDLNTSPVIARVNGRVYQVFLEEKSESHFVPSTPKAIAAPATTIPQQPVAGAPPSVEAATDVVIAPMPGDITEVKVLPGQEVQAGEPICVLDAMKMKNVIYSPQAGRVASVEVAPGQSVDYGTVLVRFE